jgi:NAD(P)H-hydrate epimerase
MNSQGFKSKIITPTEMARIEKLAVSQGSSIEQFMDLAGKAVAEAAEKFVKSHNLAKVATLLIGKGNNGGDAYTAGIALLQKGFRVQARHLVPKEMCSNLCQKKYEHFLSARGEILEGETNYLPFLSEGIILDGIFGTGFHGKIESTISTFIEAANKSSLPILAIDIPSGIDGATGKVEQVAIKATQTIFLGFAKLGCFIGDGFNYAGELIGVDFGLPSTLTDNVKPVAILIEEHEAKALLPHIKRTRHKYEAGYVIAVAGSPGMEGAATLSSTAALHTGAGMVRLFFSDPNPRSEPIEAVKEFYDLAKPERIFEECQRAHALLIGPGLGRSKAVTKMLKKVLPDMEIPTVVDADALHFYAQYPNENFPKRAVLTPHFQEMKNLLPKNFGTLTKENFLKICQDFVDKKKVTLVLKGAPTFIFSEDSAPLCICRGDPGMATGGSGDVLTGMIASLLAQGLYDVPAATLAVFIQGLSGEYAAKEKTSYCMVASDLISSLPKAFSHLLKK